MTVRQVDATLPLAENAAEAVPVAAPPSATRPAEGRWHRRRTQALAVLVLVVAAVAAVALLGAAAALPESDAPADRVLAVAVMPLEDSDGYEIPREFVGKVEAERNSALAFERAGLVDAVEVREGDAVVKGHVIARLDTEKLAARRSVLEAQLERERAALAELRTGPRPEVIASARSDLARWKSERQLAEITAQRRSRLIEQNAVSRQEYDDARLRQESLDSQVAGAQSRLDELLAGTRQEQLDAQSALVQQTKSEIDSLDVDVAKSTLGAPFAGVIAARYVDEGEVVAAGTPIVALIEMPRLRVRVGLPGDAAAALQPGQPVQVRLRGALQGGHVAAIRPDRNAATRTVTVLIGLDQPPAAIKVGDLAMLTVTRRVEVNGFWLPLPALTEGTRGLWTCYVAMPLDNRRESVTASQATHRIDSRPVELLYEATDRAFVVGPLAEGERVVSDGLHRLVPDQRVVVATR